MTFLIKDLFLFSCRDCGSCESDARRGALLRNYLTAGPHKEKRNHILICGFVECRNKDSKHMKTDVKCIFLDAPLWRSILKKLNICVMHPPDEFWGRSDMKMLIRPLLICGSPSVRCVLRCFLLAFLIIETSNNNKLKIKPVQHHSRSWL